MLILLIYFFFFGDSHFAYLCNKTIAQKDPKKKKNSLLPMLIYPMHEKYTQREHGGKYTKRTWHAIINAKSYSYFFLLHTDAYKKNQRTRSYFCTINLFIHKK